MIPALFSGLVLMAFIMLAAVLAELIQATRRQRAIKAISQDDGRRKTMKPFSFDAGTPRGRARVLAVAAPAVVLSVYASKTKAFTIGADLACTLGFVAMATVFVNAFRRRTEIEAESEAGQPLRTRLASEEVAPWAMTLGAVVVWELATYFAGFGGYRQDFPTLSVIFNDSARWTVTRGVWFFVWLAFGWGVFRP